MGNYGRIRIISSFKFLCNSDSSPRIHTFKVSSNLNDRIENRLQDAVSTRNTFNGALNPISTIINEYGLVSIEFRHKTVKEKVDVLKWMVFANWYILFTIYYNKWEKEKKYTELNEKKIALLTMVKHTSLLFIPRFEVVICLCWCLIIN